MKDLDLSAIRDSNARQWIRRLLNLIEKLSANVRELMAERQALRDEINPLQGEQGQPKVKANQVRSAESGAYSSEKERQKKRPRHSLGKKEKLAITRIEAAKVNVEELPADAQFKGYEEVTVQDVVLKTETTWFRKEKYYSASQKKTYLAKLPRGYEGQFGPGVKTLIPAWYLGMDGNQRAEDSGILRQPGPANVQRRVVHVVD